MRRPLRQFLLRLALAVPVAACAAALVGIAPVSAQTATWVKYATVSPTTTLSAGSLCYSDGRDIACDGNLSNVTGGLLSDRITSGTAGVYVSNTGVINFRTGGVTTGYFDTAGVLVAPGISITSPYGISSTNGFFTGTLGVSGSITTYGATSEIRLGNSYPRLAYWGASTAFPSLVFSGVGDGLRYNVAGAYMQLMAGGDVVAQISRTFFSISPTLSVKGISVTDYGISSTTGYFSGNVGIGTGSPSSSLHIVGSVSSSAGGITLGAGPIAKYGYIYPAGTGSLNIETATTSGGFNFKHGGATSLQVIGAGGGPTTYKSYSLAVGGLTNASATLHVSGTIMMGSDLTTCDANRLGAIKYEGGGFYVCQSASNDWEPLVTGGVSATLDRISSNSQAGVIANSSGYISFTTGGVTGTTYIDTAGRFTLPGISVTTAHGISSTNGYFSGNVGIGYSNPGYGLQVRGGLGLGGSGASGWLHLYAPNNVVWSMTPNANGSLFSLNSNANSDNFFSIGNTTGYKASVGINISTSTVPSATLHVSGTARITSWTAIAANVTATAALDVYGTVSGTAFVGDGSGLTNLNLSGSVNDRITSGTAGVYVSNTGVINFRTGGVTTGYFDTAGLLVAPGISVTSVYGISTTNLSVRGLLDIVTGTESLLVGQGAGQAMTDFTYNTAVGYNAGYSNTVDRLTAVGNRAGEFNVGSSAVLVGRLAGQYNSGTSNVGIGVAALQYNSATNVVGVGSSAGQYNTGYYATAAGFRALQNNTGTFVTSVGYTAGQNNTGSYVASLGAAAAQNNKSTYVVAVGAYALQTTSGSNLTGVGPSALQYSSGSHVTGIGSAAGQSNSGSYVIGVGSYAVRNNSGNYVTAVGYNAGLNNTYDNVTLLGNDAQASKANQVVLGNGAITEVTTTGVILAAGVSTTGAISATRFAGDGSGLTNLNLSGSVNDRITSGTAGVYVSNTGVINFRTGGVTTGYFDTAGVLVAPGISLTTGNGISSTVGYFAGLTVRGRIDVGTLSTYNTLLGPLTGWNNTGSYNINVGYSSGGGGSVSYVTSIGTYSASSNSASYLVAVGTSAGQYNTGSYATLINGGQFNRGSFASAVGIGSASSNSGTYLSALGMNAAVRNAGNFVVAIGYNAAGDNTGTNVTAVGTSAAASNTFDNVTALGYRATSDKANQVILGNSSVVEVTTSGVILSAGVSTTGTISATQFVGDGSGLTNLNLSGSVNDRITSGTAGVYVSNTGVINFRTGGVTTGYFDTAGGLVAPSISLTSVYGISTTNAHVTNDLTVGAPTSFNSASATLDVYAGAATADTDAILAIHRNQGNLIGYFSGSAGNGRLRIQHEAGSNFAEMGAYSSSPMLRVVRATSGGAQAAQYSVESTGGASWRFGYANNWPDDLVVWKTGLGYPLMTFSSSTYMVGIRVNSPTTSLEVSGTVSATYFVGDGSGLRNISASAISGLTSDRITSGTAGVYVSTTGVINFRTGGVTTGYFDTAGVLVAPGVSATGVVSSAGVYVNGDVSYTGVLTDTSDRRLKTRIAPLDGHAMEKLMLMKPVSFAMKDRPGLTEYGFIAQDVRGIFPELVFTAHDASKTMSMNYIGLIAPMVQGMQELKQENDALKARLEAQEDRLQRLERLVIDREAPVRH